MASTLLCAGCQQTLPKEILTCNLCEAKYDLQCANMTIDLYKRMTPEQRKTWFCQACRCKAPKTGNINTPIRPQDYKKSDQLNSPLENANDNNITIRKKTINNYDTTLSEDSSFLGDTIHQDDMEININTGTQAAFSLDNLSEIIMQRLKENNKCIISELQNTIEVEINKAITKLKHDIEGKTNFLYEQNDQTTQKIEEINKTIEKLSKENETLKNEIKNLKYLPVTSEIKNTEDCSKKIVIYGFSEYFKETDHDLHYRLIDMFYEIMHVDLTGYIEETNRIGRNTTKPDP